MTSFNSPIYQKSPVLESIGGLKLGHTRFGHLLETAHLPSTSPESQARPNNLAGHTSTDIDCFRRRPFGSPVASVVRKVVEDLEADGLGRVDVFRNDGRVFNSQAYLANSCQHLKRLGKRYRDETDQVDAVVEELDGLLCKTKQEKQKLQARLNFLLQKKFETEDIEFIKESRFAELNKLRSKLYRSVLENDKDASEGYLAGNGISHRTKAVDNEVLAMKCAVHLADKFDPECLLLIQRSQLLIAGLKDYQSG